jgi:DNA-binding NtrC family response regulator
MHGKADTVSDETMAVRQNWNWPGNIRELENMIERMVILSKSRVLAAPPVELVSSTAGPHGRQSYGDGRRAHCSGFEGDQRNAVG